MELTQIQITKQTREQLKDLKLTKRESYEEIIRRLLDTLKEAKENEV